MDKSSNWNAPSSYLSFRHIEIFPGGNHPLAQRGAEPVHRHRDIERFPGTEVQLDCRWAAVEHRSSVVRIVENLLIGSLCSRGFSCARLRHFRVGKLILLVLCTCVQLDLCLGLLASLEFGRVVSDYRLTRFADMPLFVAHGVIYALLFTMCGFKLWKSPWRNIVLFQQLRVLLEKAANTPTRGRRSAGEGALHRPLEARGWCMSCRLCVETVPSTQQVHAIDIAAVLLACGRECIVEVYIQNM